jgi:hypothetical protein
MAGTEFNADLAAFFCELLLPQDVVLLLSVLVFTALLRLKLFSATQDTQFQ